MQLVRQTCLGFYFYIPVEPKLVEASALVLESTCEEHLALLKSHYLENIAWDASFGPCFLQRVQNVQSVLYSLALGVHCLNKKFALCLHLISRSAHKENFYCSYSVLAPFPLGYDESDTHLTSNTDFHHESLLQL